MVARFARILLTPLQGDEAFAAAEPPSGDLECMSDTSAPLAVSIADTGDPTVARALWVLAEARRRTARALAGLPDLALEWAPPGAHAIGTLLYHIAATEMEWIYLDLLAERDLVEPLRSLFARGVRDVEGRLAPVSGETMSEHLHRLAETRAYSLDVLSRMNEHDFRRPRRMAFEARTVTAEWVVHHLAQHEAEHRGQVIQLRRGWEREDSLRHAAR